MKPTSHLKMYIPIIDDKKKKKYLVRQIKTEN